MAKQHRHARAPESEDIMYIPASAFLHHDEDCGACFFRTWKLTKWWWRVVVGFFPALLSLLALVLLRTICAALPDTPLHLVRTGRVAAAERALFELLPYPDPAATLEKLCADFLVEPMAQLGLIEVAAVTDGDGGLAERALLVRSLAATRGRKTSGRLEKSGATAGVDTSPKRLEPCLRDDYSGASWVALTNANSGTPGGELPRKNASSEAAVIHFLDEASPSAGEVAARRDRGGLAESAMTPRARQRARVPTGRLDLSRTLKHALTGGVVAVPTPLASGAHSNSRSALGSLEGPALAQGGTGPQGGKKKGGFASGIGFSLAIGTTFLGKSKPAAPGQPAAAGTAPASSDGAQSHNNILGAGPPPGDVPSAPSLLDPGTARLAAKGAASPAAGSPAQSSSGSAVVTQARSRKSLTSRAMEEFAELELERENPNVQAVREKIGNLGPWDALTMHPKVVLIAVTLA
eukprot:gene280-304_t